MPDHGLFGGRPPPPDLSGHLCAVAGCGVFGPHGFGARWYCDAHRAIGLAQWQGGPREEAVAARAGQGSLF